MDDTTTTTRSMHDDVETWDDLCSCEPEQRWADVERELESAAQQPRAETAQ